VVITVFNGESYFDRAVPSILAQTYEDFELIIADDGSTDKTPQLMEELASWDHRIMILSPGRLGRAKALNYAISHSSGEYIMVQDLDDISFPNRLAAQTEFLDQHPEVGLLGGYYEVVDSNRGERYVRMPPLEHEDIVNMMAKCVPFAHTTTAFRKEAWKQSNGYPAVDNFVDLHFWVTVARLGWKFACVPEVLGEHWVHPDSYWHRSFKYYTRQRKLAGAQARAIRELGLPKWMYAYPIGRCAYYFMPTWGKRLVRRTLGRSREQNIDRAEQ